MVDDVFFCFNPLIQVFGFNENGGQEIEPWPSDSFNPLIQVFGFNCLSYVSYNDYFSDDEF